MQGMRSLIALGLMGLILTFGVERLAVAGSIIITNVPGATPIPIKPGSKGTYRNGTLHVLCDNSLGYCPGLSYATPPTPAELPAVSLGCTGCSSARVGNQVTLSWTSQRTEACLAAHNGAPAPTSPNWAVVKNPSGSNALMIQAAGSYTLSITCYNGRGAGPTSTVTFSATN